MDKLAQDATAAIKAGMSYGRWKAMHPVTPRRDDPEKPKEEVKIRRICANCGKEFFIIKNTHRKYCSDECYRYVNNRQAKERYHKRMETEK